MNRAKMLEDCPEEFKDKIAEVIDHLEERVNDVLDSVETFDINNLDKLEDARTELTSLSQDLY
jgi:hypothetical protein